MEKSLMEKYARLIVKIGVNIQKGQTLVVTSPIECAELVRLIAQAAYDEGARDVVLNWQDEILSKIRYKNAPDEIFNEFPDWQKNFSMFYSEGGAAFLRIAASDPELMADVDPGRMIRTQKAAGIALKEYRERLMSNRNVWCVASTPTKAWAQKVFPGTDPDVAVEKLWKAILATVRVDGGDPVSAWEQHKQNLKRVMDRLNGYRFKSLHYRNSLGTDLRVDLPESHIWLGGSDFTPEGQEFIANMPTEEVFTLPEKTGVNGVVVGSTPLNVNGNLVDGFALTFKDGRVVDFRADKGYDTLKGIIETDGGSPYLGEVALVPFDSPISKLGILFYNTLFDENASCHFALGKAYPICVKGGEGMTPADLEKAGVNDSMVHEDFMIGTADLSITGTTREGEEIPVFVEGNFAF